MHTLPTILSDGQIKERCMQPVAVVRGRRKSDTRGMMSETENYLYTQPDTPERQEELLRHLREEDVKSNCYRITEFTTLREFKPMIAPFEPHQVRHRPRCDPQAQTSEKIISYGLSSYGYDVRLGNKFKIFTNINSVVIDPLNMSDDCYVDHEGDFVIIPPHSYVLGHTIEVFDMPRDVVAVCVGKSTYARVGCAINVTPIEPGFKGQVVIEIANQTPLPMKVYANQGIAQFMFHRGEPCEVSYGDRNGKYQNQTGITTARV